MVMDLISVLPRSIIESILMLLPIRDAVKTSILSKKWRYKWITIPELVFDDRQLGKIHSENRKTFIDRVLSLHKGPLIKCKFSFSSIPLSYIIKRTSIYYPDDLNPWVLYLSQNTDIQELFIDLRSSYELVKMSSCLYSCLNLSRLELKCCFLKNPPSKFLKNLKSIYFDQVFIEYSDGSEDYLSSCTSLESLTMVDFDVHALRITSPYLKYLCLSGCFLDIVIENAPLVTLSVSLSKSEETTEHLERSSSCNLIKVLGSQVHLETLVGKADFFKYLSVGYEAGKLNTIYKHLKYLELSHVNFEDKNELSVLMCLILSSPNIQKLQILAERVRFPEESPHLDFWDNIHSSDCSFKQLQIVDLRDMRVLEHDVEFIKFVLPVLKTLNIMCNLLPKKELETELLQFKRASTQVLMNFIPTSKT